jgi:carbon monoxide dehydrogenase subunit G
MKLAGDYLFEASVPEVWSALFDPVILAAVMPGCEKLDLVDGQYVGEIKVKVGPIQGKFAGKVDLKDKVEPRSYTMVVDGRGAPGFVKATAEVKLAPEGEHTRVSYDTEAQIGGKIASVGQRLLEASARAIVAQSLEGLHANIKLRAQAFREAAGPGAEALDNADGAAGKLTEAADQAGKATEAVGKATEAVGKATEATDKATEAVGKAIEAASKAAEAASKSAEVTVQAARAAKAALAASKGEAAATHDDAGKAAAVVAFTPVKLKQSALANAVAKEVARSLFPRPVLVGIILIQAAVIVWLLLRP